MCRLPAAHPLKTVNDRLLLHATAGPDPMLSFDVLMNRRQVSVSSRHSVLIPTDSTSAIAGFKVSGRLGPQVRIYQPQGQSEPRLHRAV